MALLELKDLSVHFGGYDMVLNEDASNVSGGRRF